jgi:hypothetical protein
MKDLVAKALKSAGLVPAIGTILVSWINPDYLAKLDPLRGFGGTAPHFWALGLCAVSWMAALRVYRSWPEARKLARPIHPC